MRFVRVESLSFFILASSTTPTLWYPLPPSPSGGMADAEVSKTFVARRVSSSLTSGTIPRLIAGRSPKRWPACFRFGHAAPRSPPDEQEIELLPNTRLHMPTIAHLADCGLVALAQSDKHAIEAAQTGRQGNFLPLNANLPVDQTGDGTKPLTCGRSRRSSPGGGPPSPTSAISRRPV